MAIMQPSCVVPPWPMLCPVDGTFTSRCAMVMGTICSPAGRSPDCLQLGRPMSPACLPTPPISPLSLPPLSMPISANSLAPDRIAWGRDNRGAMLRVIDRLSPAATRVENRVGEPAANPYLYIFSQALAGLDGIRDGLTLQPAVDCPYAVEAERLPRSLDAAIGRMQSWSSDISSDPFLEKISAE